MIEVSRGADVDVKIELFTDAEETVPADLSTVTPTIIRETIEPTAVVTDALNGEITLSFPSELTGTLRKNGRYVFTILLDYGGGVEDVLPEMTVFAR